MTMEEYRNKVFNIDCREGLKQLPEASIDCAITSPPYWNLRDYKIEPSIWDGAPNCEHNFKIEERKLHSGRGLDENKNLKYSDRNEIPDQIITSSSCSKCGAWKGVLGLEPNFELYIKHLCNIYDLVWRVLKPTGTNWVNLGDSHNGTGGGHKFENRESYKKYNPNLNYDNNGKCDKSLPNKCLLMLPYRFAIEMCNRGWILRNVIIWHKKNCMPSSARDRFTVDFEPIFFFTKSKKYWFDQDAVREPLLKESKRRVMRGTNINKYSSDKHLPKGVHSNTLSQPKPYRGYNNMEEEIKKGNTSLNPNGRNKRCVWTINTIGNPESHFATFPLSLVKPMILSGCPKEVCNKCGKPRERLIKKETFYSQHKNDSTRKYGNSDDRNDAYFSGNSEYIKHDPKIEFIGWIDCGCKAGFSPGIVLDIFTGTGTTLLQAWKLGRDYIGFEISKEYCKIIKRRLNVSKNKRIDDFL